MRVDHSIRSSRDPGGAQAGLGHVAECVRGRLGQEADFEGPRALMENAPHWLEARTLSQRCRFGDHSRALELEDTSG